MVFFFMVMVTFTREEHFLSSNIHSKCTNTPKESGPYVFISVKSCIDTLIFPSFSVAIVVNKNVSLAT